MTTKRNPPNLSQGAISRHLSSIVVFTAGVAVGVNLALLPEHGTKHGASWMKIIVAIAAALLAHFIP